MKIQSFKATTRTNRWNKGQRVWINMLFGNHIYVYFKFRGKGRYVKGTVDRWSPAVGKIEEFDVDDEFAERILKMI